MAVIASTVPEASPSQLVHAEVGLTRLQLVHGNVGLQPKLRRASVRSRLHHGRRSRPEPRYSR